MIRRPPRSTPFPTRRSSDLEQGGEMTFGNAAPTSAFPVLRSQSGESIWPFAIYPGSTVEVVFQALKTDRKSTRLNSSHLVISYAVFCLKKKNHCDDSCSDNM